MKYFIFFTFVCLNIMSCTHQKQTDDYKIVLGKVPNSAKFIDNQWYIWGGSVIESEGKYHMFYSRWPKKYHFNAWLTYSEVAHAVADSPTGPYKHVDVALPERDSTFWDGHNTHNPTVKEFDGKFYLYYTGNHGDRVVKEKGYNWSHRNNQRIGVAVADNINGPWKRFDKPLLELSTDSLGHDALMMANPSVTRAPDGRYVLVYKCVGKKRKLPAGGPVVHMVAFSDAPTGPFKKYPEPIFTAEGHDFPAEDPYIWTQDDKFYAIVKDFRGTFTKQGQSLALFESNDAISWSLSKNPLVSTMKINWEEHVQSVKHLERPQLFLKDGKPYALMCAADTLDDRGVYQSFNVQIPIINH
ncbi:glycoside hydrolase family protein [Persicobacter psychrovividus]|uniref:Sucrase n=1 Tax=Persicobacter psychrovividus TaxID=387638 RepID=A0ABN6LGK6_9BACT|nr:hypothetical protein PEPS_45630 [Persicobacter psychrovividus]